MSEGRRATDTWPAKVGGGVMVLGLVYSVAAWGLPLVGRPERVEMLEQSQPAMLLMTCVMYRESGHATSLPAVCDQVLSRGGR